MNRFDRHNNCWCGELHYIKTEVDFIEMNYFKPSVCGTLE